jgi:ribonuclease P protein component
MTPPDGGARKRRRLSRSGEFDRVYREGTSHANRYLVLYAFPRRDDEPDEGGDEVRLGVSATRKVGGAVERNRAKRALREAFWTFAGKLPAGHDFVLVARPPLGELLDREGAGALEPCVREALEETVGRERFA